MLIPIPYVIGYLYVGFVLNAISDSAVGIDRDFDLRRVEEHVFCLGDLSAARKPRMCNCRA